MTPKFLATQPNKRVLELFADDLTLEPLIHQDAKLIPFLPHNVKVGDKVFMAKRINKHHGQVRQWVTKTTKKFGMVGSVICSKLLDNSYYIS